MRGGRSGVAFLELWPPLKPQWRPRCESKVGADLLDDRIHLAGKVDLSIGVADGMRAGKVLIDLKTGGFSPSHLDDLRFYALIETIKLGVPPRRVATHYLDTGKLVPEDVTEATLAVRGEAARSTVSDAGSSCAGQTRRRSPSPAPRAGGAPSCPPATPGRTHMPPDA